MQTVLMYHDVVPPGGFEMSGFSGPAAARYKLEREEFYAHVLALSERCRTPSREVGGAPQPDNARLLLTFDDGGVSAITEIADPLEKHGWRGHFFVTTDYIGRPGFLSREQIRELRRRGHVIGTHSCSHPPRMSVCTYEQIADEWTRSIRILSDILDEPVTVGSVPGGFYSAAVARAAAAAGMRTLFNSEPTNQIRVVDGCTVRGRYAIFQGTSPQTAAALASGNRLAQLRQASAWNIKKFAKAVGGAHYLQMRSRIFNRAASRTSASPL